MKKKKTIHIIIADSNSAFRTRLNELVKAIEFELGNIRLFVTEVGNISDFSRKLHKEISLVLIDFLFIIKNKKIFDILKKNKHIKLTLLISSETKKVKELIGILNKYKEIIANQFIMKDNYSNGLITLLLKDTIAQL